MQKYLIAALIIAAAVLLETSFILHALRADGGLAEAAAQDKKRPTPTPRPTPRPNMNDGGGVYERWHRRRRNPDRNTPPRFERRYESQPHGRLSDNANTVTPRAKPGMFGNVTGASAPGTGSKARRARRRAPPRAFEPVEPETTGGALAGGAITPARPVGLSGTYTGLVSDEARAVTGEKATLTITGDSYTLESESLTYSGRFVVNTTRGYQAVTMELGPQAPGQSPPPFVSLRASRVVANRLVLTSASGERRQFSFISEGSDATRARRRKRRR